MHNTRTFLHKEHPFQISQQKENVSFVFFSLFVGRHDFVIRAEFRSQKDNAERKEGRKRRKLRKSKKKVVTMSDLTNSGGG